MEKVWEPKLDVNTNNIIYNIENIKKYVGPNVGIMPIIKDSAYGTGINTRLDIFEKTGTKIVGVAIVDEGIFLRELGYNGEIFILNQPYSTELDAIIKYDLTIGVGSVEYIDILGKHPRKI